MSNLICLVLYAFALAFTKLAVIKDAIYVTTYKTKINKIRN